MVVLMTRQDRGVLEYDAVHVREGRVCLGGGAVDGRSWVRYKARMGEEGRVKCRGREGGQAV